MSGLIWGPMSASRSTGGRSWTLAVLIASSMTMEFVAVSADGFSVSGSSIALMPNGVAAFPSPSQVAVS